VELDAVKIACLSMFTLCACAGDPTTKPAGAADSTPPADSADSATPSSWRSTLYPDDWAPGFSTEAGQLRDFSYAGYRAGAVPLPTPSAEDAVDVRDFGADPTGESDSTAAIQAAIDAAAATVYLPEGLYKVDGALLVTHDHTVLLGDGSDRTRLWFTATDTVDRGAHLTFRGSPTADLSVPLTADSAFEADRVRVASGSGLVVGDEVWVGITITDDFISDHGMDGYWTFSHDAWRPFFRRTVTAVTDLGDGTEDILLDVTLPYPLTTRDGARIERVDGYLDEVGLVGVGVSNAVDWVTAWSLTQVHAVAFEGVRDAYISDLATFETPTQPGYHLQSSGILVRNSRRVTLADSRLENPQNRGEGGNGYLVDIRTSNAVLVRDTTALAGRHNFIQNWDFGASDLVFLRTHSAGGEAFTSSADPAGATACSETHHALAIAVLVDDSTTDDCWKMVNRLSYSSGAGHTATESVFWNVRGDGGSLTSHQFGRGYVVGTDGLDIITEVIDIYESQGTAPEDHTEGLDEAATLEPQSLYDDQLARRTGR